MQKHSCQHYLNSLCTSNKTSMYLISLKFVSIPDVQSHEEIIRARIEIIIKIGLGAEASHKRLVILRISDGIGTCEEILYDPHFLI